MVNCAGFSDRDAGDQPEKVHEHLVGSQAGVDGDGQEALVHAAVSCRQVYRHSCVRDTPSEVGLRCPLRGKNGLCRAVEKRQEKKQQQPRSVHHECARGSSPALERMLSTSFQRFLLGRVTVFTIAATERDGFSHGPT